MIKNAILEGKNELLETIEIYKTYLEKHRENLENIKVTSALMDENFKIKQSNAEKKVNAVTSRIDYINFIIKELDGIVNFELIDEKPDFANHCVYFGNGTLYHSNKFTEMSNKEMFDTILNHIIYYTGALYIPTNEEVVLSYVISAFSICYNIKVDFKLGKDIYKTYHKSIGHKILKISNKNFFIRNNSKLGFLKLSYHQDYYITYRILIGNIIKLKSMRLKIDNVEQYKMSISDINYPSLYDKDMLFKLS